MRFSLVITDQQYSSIKMKKSSSILGGKEVRQEKSSILSLRKYSRVGNAFFESEIFSYSSLLPLSHAEIPLGTTRGIMERLFRPKSVDCFIFSSPKFTDRSWGYNNTNY